VRRVPAIRQHDARDCGPACLAAVAAYHGLRLPIARLRQQAATDLRGTTVLALVETAQQLGLGARAVRGGPEALPSVPTPAIAHVALPSGAHHFVVLCGVGRRGATIMDPAQGRRRRLPLSDFCSRWTGVLVLLAPGEAFRPGNACVPPLRRFVALVRPHRSVLAEALAGATAYSALGLGTAIYVQKIVDDVLVDGGRALLHALTAGILLVLLLQAYFGVMKARLVLRTGQSIDAALVLGYYRHLLALPGRFFDTIRLGDVVSRVNDAVKIRAFINETAVDLAVNALVLLLSATLMLAYSPRLAGLVLGALPLYAVLFAVANRLGGPRQRRLMEAAAELEAHLVESLGAVGTIRRLGLERAAGLHTEVRLVRVLRAVRRSATLAIGTGAAAQLVSALLAVLVLWRGSLLVLDGALTPGRLMSFYALSGYLTGPVIALVNASRPVQDALVAADRLFELMDLERENDAGTVRLEPGEAREIRFRDVAFGYAPHAPVFAGLSLVIPPGKVTAVVGESGCGKSTLVALTQRLYPITAGSILVGGIDIRQIAPDSLRRAIALVPQRIDLFSGTVAENIAAGDAQPDMRRVLAVSALLGLETVVQRLPSGFETRLTENGAALSGGERQRIAIARALYRDPDVLFLDEATSALDAHAEALVRRIVRQYRQDGRTVVIVAHRLTTALDADRIVVLGGGSVRELGTHRELLARGGDYAALWAAQMAPPDPGPTAPATAAGA